MKPTPWPPVRPPWLPFALAALEIGLGCLGGLAIYAFAQWLANTWNPFL